MPLARVLLSAAAMIGLDADAQKPPSRKELAGWCRAAEGTPAAIRCTDYLYAVANHVDQARSRSGLPQCIPAGVTPASLRQPVAKALVLKRPGNADPLPALVASILVDGFGCTSDPHGKPAPTPPPNPPPPPSQD